jgi:hypothetical protein
MRALLSAAIAATSVSALLPAQNFPCFEQNLGTNLNLGDDQVASGLPLGFTFTGPGNVTTTSIDVASNGFVWLATSVNPRCCNGEAQKFVIQQPSIAPLWMDLDPSAAPAGGGVFFNAFPAVGSAPARAVVTWSNVPEFGSSSPPFTFQLQLDANGRIFFYYDPNVSVQNHQALIGVTEGNANPTGSAQSNYIDISQTQPPIDTGTNPTFFEVLGWLDVQNRTFEIVPNGLGGYTISDPSNCVPAAWSTYGAGCPRPPVFYEWFQSPTAIDLSNTAVLVSPNGVGGWTVTPTVGFYTPQSAPIQTGDDFVTGPFALPWTWSWPGGSTTAIDVSSNGFIWLSTGNFNSRCCSGDPWALLNDPASICAHWMDHNPNSAGTIHVDTDPLTSEVHVTWLNVAEYGSSSTLSTFQITLSPAGSFRLSWQNVGSAFHDSLTGFAPDFVGTDPGTMDLSAAVPFDTGPGGAPLVLDAVGNGRPQIGTTFLLELANAPPTSGLGVMVFGFTQLFPGLDLTPLGMPGCSSFTSLDALFAFPLLPVPQFGIALPNNAAIVGTQLFVQGAVLAPGLNAFGLITSNAGQMLVGI